jgi:hypothetical protein
MVQLFLWDDPNVSLDDFKLTLNNISGLNSKLRKAVKGGLDEAKGRQDTIDDLDPTEKTVIGIKVESYIRDGLALSRGKDCDCKIEDFEFDIKTTVRNNWCISPKQVRNKSLLLLIKLDDTKFSCGILKVSEGILNKGANRDKKRNISKSGKDKIIWILKNKRY